MVRTTASRGAMAVKQRFDALPAIALSAIPPCFDADLILGGATKYDFTLIAR
jgi:hypothetical protein